MIDQALDQGCGFGIVDSRVFIEKVEIGDLQDPEGGIRRGGDYQRIGLWYGMGEQGGIAQGSRRGSQQE